MGGKENNAWSDRLCIALLNLAEALPASEAGASYNVLVQKNHTLETFFTKVNDMNNLTCFTLTLEQSQLSTLGFGKREVCTNKRMICALFYLNSDLVLETQIRLAQENEIYFQSACNGPSSLPNSTVIGDLAFRAV